MSLPNYNFPLKLKSDNYPLWKFQILPTIIGCNIAVFIMGELQAPSEVVTEHVAGNSTGTREVVNPDFMVWRRLDQALVGWLLSSITKEVLTQVNKVSSSVTAFQLWASLEKLFGT